MIKNILQYRYYILSVLIVVTLSITNITSCRKAVELSEQIKVQVEHPKVIYKAGKERVVNTNTETTREKIIYKDGTIVEKEKIVNRDIIKEKEVEKRVEIPVYTVQNGQEWASVGVKYLVIGDSGSKYLLEVNKPIYLPIYLGVSVLTDLKDINKTSIYIGVGIKF